MEYSTKVFEQVVFFMQQLWFYVLSGRFLFKAVTLERCRQRWFVKYWMILIVWFIATTSKTILLEAFYYRPRTQHILGVSISHMTWTRETTGQSQRARVWIKLGKLKANMSFFLTHKSTIIPVEEWKGLPRVTLMRNNMSTIEVNFRKFKNLKTT